MQGTTIRDYQHRNGSSGFKIVCKYMIGKESRVWYVELQL